MGEGCPSSEDWASCVGGPLLASRASLHPSQKPLLLSGSSPVQENQFFSPMSTYPESCVHVLVVTGECPSDILMPDPVHVPSCIPIPTVPTPISVSLRTLSPTPDFSRHHSCFVGRQRVAEGRPAESGFCLEEAAFGG